MILKIKNMESRRCKILVKQEMDKLGLQNITVELGEIEFEGDISGEKLQLFDSALKKLGLKILVDKRSQLVAKIKDAVYQLVYLTGDHIKPDYSNFISEKVNISYNSLSTIFSAKENITIEKYIIAQRIERVKELLIYSDINLSDIAFKMHFSSVAHLSTQFKKVTGLTPSFFRNNRNDRNNELKM
ncbi:MULTISPECIES: helix-turn-helix domain-containing protein [Maribellus]|uniref:Helix-turn-helix domain-containing protein n=1 Tax=Maribellus comscasis TaxID=2681766 RepID=A0A6I6JUB5_9BACT|nr:MULTISPECIES: AraC family transcriptional regulator [Maribellus]MCG6190942.1 AraC family transcriptional regulator [Maribellus maritimus]QGY46121.1 helix-turn-helix domain-containing protein [Maribellus comscasis]